MGTYIDTPEVLVHCNLTQFHMPRGSRVQFSGSFGRCQLMFFSETVHIVHEKPLLQLELGAFWHRSVTKLGFVHHEWTSEMHYITIQYLCQMLTNFKNIFTATLVRKFNMQLSQKISTTPIVCSWKTYENLISGRYQNLRNTSALHQPARADPKGPIWPWPFHGFREPAPYKVAQKTLKKLMVSQFVSLALLVIIYNTHKLSLSIRHINAKMLSASGALLPWCHDQRLRGSILQSTCGRSLRFTFMRFGMRWNWHEIHAPGLSWGTTPPRGVTLFQKVGGTNFRRRWGGGPGEEIFHYLLSKRRILVDTWCILTY